MEILVAIRKTKDLYRFRGEADIDIIVTAHHAAQAIRDFREEPWLCWQVEVGRGE